MARLLLNGKLPTDDELISDDRIAQMLQEATEKGKAEAVTKESVIQALTVADVPDTIKQELTKDAPTKESIVQALTAEDVALIPESVKQAIVESVTEIPPVVEKFVKQAIGAMKGEAGEKEGEKKEEKSALRQMRERTGIRI
jgi:hypothetical protein